MTSLQDLLAQQAALTKQIEEMRSAERADAINKVKALISEHELTQKDLFEKATTGKKVKATGKVPAKYRNPVSGKEWSGRGMEPKWIKDSGKAKEDFLIAS